MVLLVSASTDGASLVCVARFLACHDRLGLGNLCSKVKGTVMQALAILNKGAA